MSLHSGRVDRVGACRGAHSHGMPYCAKLHKSLEELSGFSLRKALPVVAPDPNYEEL
jgi:hypothetical protein